MIYVFVYVFGNSHAHTFTDSTGIYHGVFFRLLSFELFKN